MSTNYTFEITDVSENKIATVDPRLLDRLADVLVSQGFERQGTRIAHLAAEIREGGR
jgi:hypothetical protein